MLTVHCVQVRVPLRPLSLAEQHARDGGSEDSGIGNRPVRQLARVPHCCRGVLEGRGYGYGRHRDGEHGEQQARVAG